MNTKLGLLMVVGLTLIGCHAPHYGLHVRNQSPSPIWATVEMPTGQDNENAQVINPGNESMIYVGQSRDGRPNGITVIIMTPSKKELKRIDAGTATILDPPLDWVIDYR